MNTALLLRRINRWWQDDNYLQKKLPNRARGELQSVINEIDNKRITCIIGPRRVGKSTIMQHAIGALLDRGVDPTRVLYFSCDEPGLMFKDIHEIIDVYCTEIVNEAVFSLSKKIYVFIDEIHTLSDWQLYLKSYFDREYEIKFVVSGSSAAHQYFQSRESLLGRIADIIVLPLDFRQFTEFWLDAHTRELVLPPKISYFAGSLQAAHEQCQLVYKSKDEYEAILSGVINEYLLVGGYPGYFSETGTDKWLEILDEDIISRGLFRDIVSSYGVQNPEYMERLLYFVADNQGSEFSWTTIAQTLNADVSTISKYVEYLQRAMLLTVQECYSVNVGKVIRKNKKLSVTDNGLRNATLKNFELSETETGRLIENCVLNTVSGFANANRGSVYYWREQSKEVDIVLDTITKLLPIEVKYRGTINIKQARTGIDAFSSKFPRTDGAIIVTKNYLDYSEGILFVPFWLFVLTL